MRERDRTPKKSTRSNSEIGGWEWIESYCAKSVLMDSHRLKRKCAEREISDRFIFESPLSTK